MNFIINLFFNISEYLLWVLDAVFFYKILNYFVSQKNNFIFKLLSILGSFFLVRIMIFPEDIVNVLGAFILFLMMMFLCFSNSPIHRIAVVFIIFPLIIAINFLMENMGLQTYLALGGILLEDIGAAAFASSSHVFLDFGVHFFYSLLRTGLWFLLYKVLHNRLANVKKLLTKGMWAMIAIICLAPLSSIVSFVIFTPQSNVLAYPAMISSIITVVGILIFTGYIANTVVNEMENRNLSFQKEYYDELERSQRETAKLRHDMNNHLAVIATFIKDENTEEAQSYYNNFANKLLAQNRVFCKNNIVNAVINAKYNRAVEEQIDCFFNIDLANILSIDDINLCSIFANTLDNAIEACQLVNDISKRSISLKARYEKGYFTYEISNSKEHSIIEKNGIFKSNKKDKKNHGYGLANIRDIVESYDGALSITHTENLFTLNMLLQDL